MRIYSTCTSYRKVSKGNLCKPFYPRLKFVKCFIQGHENYIQHVHHTGRFLREIFVSHCTPGWSLLNVSYRGMKTGNMLQTLLRIHATRYETPLTSEELFFLHFPKKMVYMYLDILVCCISDKTWIGKSLCHLFLFFEHSFTNALHPLMWKNL